MKIKSKFPKQTSLHGSQNRNFGGFFAFNDAIYNQYKMYF